MRFNIAFFASLLLIIVSFLSIPETLSVILTILLVLVIIVCLGKDIPFIKPFLVSTTVVGTQSGEPTFIDKAPQSQAFSAPSASSSVPPTPQN